MKSCRAILKSCLAVALVLGALPSWACVHSRGATMGTSLACVKACARSGAILTRNGALPGMSEGVCGVRVQAAAAPGILPAGFSLAQPAAGFAVLGGTVELTPPCHLGARPAGRSPPLHPSFLSFQYPFANAPPTLV